MIEATLQYASLCKLKNEVMLIMTSGHNTMLYKLSQLPM